MNSSLELQARKIEEYRNRSQPLDNVLAGVHISVLANVYTGGADSEVICENMEIRPGDRVLDLCTGNGIIALYAATHGAAEVVGTDLNPAAVENARLNGRNLGADNARFLETDLFPDQVSKFDIITINPPYTDHPAPDNVSVCFWDEGNQVTKRFFNDLPQYLTAQGTAYIAWSDFANQELLPALAAKHGYKLKKAGQKAGRSGFKYYAYELKIGK